MIIIAGIHGGGTRYVSHCINRVIPMWITEAGGGHNEDAEILNINIKELQHRKLNWWDIKPGRKKGTIQEDLKKWKAKREKTTNEYGLKDPRIIGLITDYRKVFIGAKYVVCVRDREKVIHSHLKAGRVPSREAAENFYDKEMEKIKRIKCHVVNMSGNPREEQKKLSEYLGFDVDLVSEWLAS